MQRNREIRAQRRKGGIGEIEKERKRERERERETNFLLD